MMVPTIALLLLAAFVPSRAAASEAPLSCEVEIRLTSITSLRTLDEDESGAAEAPGEYFVSTLTAASLGPFGLRTGDASSFAPGLSLEMIDTGWPYPPEGESVIASVSFGVLVREDDSNPVGEDDHDDTSEQLLIREHVVCPGGVTRLTRTIDVTHNNVGGPRRRSDQVRLGLQIRAVE